MISCERKKHVRVFVRVAAAEGSQDLVIWQSVGARDSIEVLTTILNLDLTDDQWMQASLPIRNVGLGVRSAQMLAPSAFLASATFKLSLQNAILPLSVADCEDIEQRRQFFHPTLSVLHVTAEVAVLNWTIISKKKVLPICQYLHSLQLTEVGWHFGVRV